MGLRSIALFASVAGLIHLGCSSSERPEAESGAVGSVAQVESPETTTDTTEPVHPVCVPSSIRECKVSWTSPSEPGVQHCFSTTQRCTADGRGWRACGDTDFDAGAS